MTPRRHAISAMSWTVLALVLLLLVIRFRPWPFPLNLIPCGGFGFSLARACFHYVRIPRPPV